MNGAITHIEIGTGSQMFVQVRCTAASLAGLILMGQMCKGYHKEFEAIHNMNDNFRGDGKFTASLGCLIVANRPWLYCSGSLCIFCTYAWYIGIKTPMTVLGINNYIVGV